MTTTYYDVPCPVCGEKVAVDTGLVPCRAIQDDGPEGSILFHDHGTTMHETCFLKLTPEERVALINELVPAMKVWPVDG
jgi:hypothetical protein